MSRLGRLPWRLRYVTAPAATSRLRKLSVKLTHLHAEVRFEGPAYLGPGFSLYIPDRGSLVVGPGVQFRRGFTAEIYGEGRIVIGEGTVFTYDVILACTTSIEIGKRCGLGQATIVTDGNHRFRDPNLPTLSQGYDYRPIRIGDDVAIPSKCTIMADIGDHSWIGANSVVNRDIPPYSLAVGAPARVVDRFGPEEAQERVSALGTD